MDGCVDGVGGDASFACVFSPKVGSDPRREQKIFTRVAVWIGRDRGSEDGQVGFLNAGEWDPSLLKLFVKEAIGVPAFPGASIFTKTHTQVAVRDPAVIVGYFRPSRYTSPGA